MTIEAMLTILIALAALVVSIVSLVKTSDNAAQNTRLSNGNLEIQVREMISSARRHLSSCIHDKAMVEINPELQKNEELQKKIEQLITAAFQDYANAYEEACMKYIDNKIDRERFRKTYIVEITNLVKKHESMFGTASVYTAIKKVLTNGIIWKSSLSENGEWRPHFATIEKDSEFLRAGPLGDLWTLGL